MHNDLALPAHPHPLFSLFLPHKKLIANHCRPASYQQTSPREVLIASLPPREVLIASLPPRKVLIALLPLKMPITYEEFIVKSHTIHSIATKLTKGWDNDGEEEESDNEEDGEIPINMTDDVLFSMCKDQRISSKLISCNFFPEATMPFEMFCQDEKKYLHCMYQPSNDHPLVFDFDYLKTLAPKLQKCFVEMYFKRNPEGDRAFYLYGTDTTNWQYYYQSLETFDDFIDFYNAMTVMQKQETQRNKLFKAVGEKMFNDVVANINHITHINQQYDKTLKKLMIRDFETKLKAQNALLRSPVEDGLLQSPTEDGLLRLPTEDGLLRLPTEMDKLMSIVEQETEKSIADNSQQNVCDETCPPAELPVENAEQLNVDEIYHAMQQGNQSFFDNVTNMLNVIMQNLDNETPQQPEDAIHTNTPDVENVEQSQFDTMIREIMQTNVEEVEKPFEPTKDGLLHSPTKDGLLRLPTRVTDDSNIGYYETSPYVRQDMFRPEREIREEPEIILDDPTIE
jgi:hypothetical protein